MELIESGDVFYCKVLKSMTTYTSVDVALSLIALAGDRFSSLTGELERAYETIRTEGPITRRRLSEICDYPTKPCKAILRELVDRLLITAFERGRKATNNWDELGYWTVDEWLLGRGIEPPCLHTTEQDEATVLTAASKCLMSDDPRELAKALRWQVERVRGHLGKWQ